MASSVLNSTADSAAFESQNGTLQLDPFESSLPLAWDYFFAVMMTCIIVTGFTLNLVVICTFFKHKGRKNMAVDFFILALATSDLLVASTAYPMTLASIISHRWIFGHTGCVINGFLGFVFSLFDIGILCTMSIVRLLMVKLPYCAIIKRTSCTAGLVAAVVFYSMFWTIAPVLGWGEFVPEPFGTSCTVNWMLPDKSYVTSIFIAVLVIPSTLMVISYCSVVVHMKRNSDKVDRYFTERRRRTKRQNRLIKMTVTMCACFLLTWAPYAVVSICSAYIPNFEIDAVQSAIPTVLAKCSHVFNPIIYFSTNSKYRTRLKLIWYRKSLSSRGTDARTAKLTAMTDQVDNSFRSSSVSNRDINLTTPSHQPFFSYEDPSNTLLSNGNGHSSRIHELCSDTGDVLI